MSTPQTQTTPPATATKPAKTEFELLLEKDVKTLSWITPYGADEGYTIPLSVKLIREYVAVPFYDKHAQKLIEAPDTECFRFIALCKARRLNPYEGDAYMIPFWDSSINGPKWSLITSHNAFLKRAELHSKYDGMDSGIIVLDANKHIVEREGDFEHPGDQLLGGWAVVYIKDRGHPKKAKVKLTTYKKPFGVWLKDEAGMICKVAEAHAIRDSFPTIIGGAIMREEIDETGVPIDAKKPAFTHDGMDMLRKVNAAAETKPEPEKKPRSRPTMVEEPLTPPVPEPEPPTTNGGEKSPPPPPAPPAPAPVDPPPVTTPTAATPELVTPPAATETPEQKVKRLAKSIVDLGVAAGLTTDQINTYLVKFHWKKENQKLVEVAENKLVALLNAWSSKPVAELGVDLKAKLEKK
jgi:phage recombination protein Bet